jgi:hypothetical protein
MLASGPDYSIRVIDDLPVKAPAPLCHLSRPEPTTGKYQQQNPSLARGRSRTVLCGGTSEHHIKRKSRSTERVVFDQSARARCVVMVLTRVELRATARLRSE